MTRTHSRPQHEPRLNSVCACFANSAASSALAVLDSSNAMTGGKTQRAFWPIRRQSEAQLR